MDKKALIDGGFMSLTTSSFPDHTGDGVKTFKVRLQHEYKIASVFVQSKYDSKNNLVSKILIGDDGSMNESSDDLLNSGFFLIKSQVQLAGTEAIEYSPTNGQDVWIRRNGYNKLYLDRVANG